MHSRPLAQPPRIDVRPDGRGDRRDEHDRNRWRSDDARRDDRRWNDRSRDDVRRDRDSRPWPGFSPRGDGAGSPDGPQLRDRRDLRDEARPPRIFQERPPGGREGLLRAEPPRDRAARPELRPAGAAGEAREPHRSEAGGRPPEGFRGFRRDDDGEARRSFRREARDGGNAPEARGREPAGN